jgi:hypothetical protein
MGKLASWVNRGTSQALSNDLWQLGRAWRRAAARKRFAQVDHALWHAEVKAIVLDHMPREHFATRAEYRRLVRAAQRLAKRGAAHARVQYNALASAQQRAYRAGAL